MRQTMYGTIVGNVADTSGALVPGAMVEATQIETNETRSGVSNQDGRYTLATLPAGTYRVAISKQGFGKFTAESVNLSINSIVRVDASLAVNAATETVQVTSERAELQTDSAGRAR